MKRLTTTGLIEIDQNEAQRIRSLVIDNHSKDFHYLAFARELGGFNPLGAFLSGEEAIREKGSEIIAALLAKQEVGSFYPEKNLTLYPPKRIDGAEYELDLEHIDKHFKDILYLNDKVYKTKYLFVDFGHGASNFDEPLILEKLRELQAKSTILEDVIIEA